MQKLDAETLRHILTLISEHSVKETVCRPITFSERMIFEWTKGDLYGKIRRLLERSYDDDIEYDIATRLNTVGLNSPCPYCGKAHVFIVKKNNEWSVECPRCHARSERADTLKTAVKNWEKLYEEVWDEQ